MSLGLGKIERAEALQVEVIAALEDAFEVVFFGFWWQMTLCRSGTSSGTGSLICRLLSR